MPRHLPRPPRRLWDVLGHSRSCVLLGVLVVALVTPATAVAAPSHKRRASAPRCTHFSLAKLAHYLYGHHSPRPLHFEGKTPGLNACTYVSPLPGHYSILLQVAVQATSEAVYLGAEQRAKMSASERGATLVISKSNRLPFYFYVDGTITSDSLEPCRSPGAALPAFGPPTCNGQPDWTTISVDTYGALRPRGPKLFVSVGVGTEEAQVHPEDLVALSKAILSGQIH